MDYKKIGLSLLTNALYQLPYFPYSNSIFHSPACLASSHHVLRSCPTLPYCSLYLWVSYFKVQKDYLQEDALKTKFPGDSDANKIILPILRYRKISIFFSKTHLGYCNRTILDLYILCRL